MNSKIKSFFQIFLPLLLGGFISFLIRNHMDYDSFAKPPFSPPAIVFPIAWTILYLLMGISYYLYAKNKENDSSLSFLYYLQLAVNLIWPILFFNFRFFFFSIIWIILLVILVFIYIRRLFHEDYPLSAYLFIPYFIWLLLATYLNIGVYLLN